MYHFITKHAHEDIIILCPDSGARKGSESAVAKGAVLGNHNFEQPPHGANMFRADGLILFDIVWYRSTMMY